MAVSMQEKSLKTVDEIEHIILPERLLQASNPDMRQNPSPGRRMQKVPARLRLEQNYLYDPTVVSLGPYHHGKKELQLAEDFKVKALQILVAGSGKTVNFFYTEVLERVNDARNSYINNSTTGYGDPTFAQMMLLDSCFIISFMLSCVNEKVDGVIKNHFGDLNYLTNIFCDMFLLENQIPFWLVMLLISSRYDHERSQDLLKTFFNANFFEEYVGHGKDIIQNQKAAPSHLLEALRLFLLTQDPPRSGKMVTGKAIPPLSFSGIRLLMMKAAPPPIPSPSLKQKLLAKLGKFNLHYCISKFSWFWPRRKDNAQYTYQKYYFPSFRSATDLKAKGIHFRPSSGGSLRNIKFKSGYFYAQHEVPSWVVGKDTKVLFSNLIAYEMCQDDHLEGRVVTAYINFLKSLIDNAKDVKELREKEILRIPSGSDEEIVKLFNEVNPLGILAPFSFQDVTKKIEAHFNNKAKTWLAEFVYTYFRSPWTAIALFAATFLLILTLLQPYFAIHPKK